FSRFQSSFPPQAMAAANRSVVTEFTLAGFTDRPDLQVVLFVVFLTMYVVTLTGNLGMSLLINFDPRLHTPMYFFLSHLSLLDVCYSSCVTPRFLLSLLAGRRAISYAGCLAQFYFYAAFGTTEAFLLAAMAYDRYVAVCSPLLYAPVMSRGLCLRLVAGCYAAGAVNSAAHTGALLRLSFCASSLIDHFYCEGPPLYAISCSDTGVNATLMLVFVSCIVGAMSATTLASYGRILAAVLRTHSPRGGRKAFSTCTSHLSVTLLFYGSVAFVYLRPSSRRSGNLDKTASLLYTAVTPMLNPLIYSLRNQEVRDALRRARRKVLLTCQRRKLGL
ncbi:O1030 protein, partial [Chauna torquata]|nr:O1030 protein [Chauna torquata]